MTGFFSKLFGRKDPALEDAARIYSALMEQARKAEFYGDGKAPDNYDGRIDILTLHIAVILEALSVHGKQGELLSQAIFDVMRDDFEIAMREEGLSDTGIKRRIKPMMQLFYTRVKAYTQAIKSPETKVSLEQALKDGLLEGRESMYASSLAAYTVSFSQNLQDISLGQIALTDFAIPEAPNL
ncbi:ubiquinol-cytochrome C chaperone family protein [Hellea balneolensis]|uniref:ubiquinol-cytochrome C chaperone family protein n=1 Tax=Hellea balneolensis TaxID=287478 RepID=UPI0003F536D7|nr:ubiquinol-cytochrome C chaperone family protein [Hellea balneolensis]